VNKVLLIDGSQVLLDITKRILERAGYTVHCAVGAEGAREILADYSPDGIVLEVDLSDATGLDYYNELREKTSVPIMVLSNNKGDELTALQAGANDFLKKPFDYEIMTARIGAMLKCTEKEGTH